MADPLREDQGVILTAEFPAGSFEKAKAEVDKVMRSVHFERRKK